MRRGATFSGAPFLSAHSLYILSFCVGRLLWLIVKLQYVQGKSAHLLAHCFRLYHLQLVGLRQYHLIEVECRFKMIFKQRRLLVAAYFALRLMQRQRAQIIHKVVVCTHHNPLQRLVRRNHSAAALKVFRRVESLFISKVLSVSCMSIILSRAYIRNTLYGLMPFSRLRSE